MQLLMSPPDSVPLLGPIVHMSTVTWQSPQRFTPNTPLRGYVIYYQPKGGPVNSVNLVEEYLGRGIFT